MACCIATFGYQLSIDSDSLGELVNQYGVVPASMLENAAGVRSFSDFFDRIIPLWSSAFLHGGPFHLAGNMLFLWIFGNNVEDAMGHFKFFVFYMLAAAAAMLVQAVPDANSAVPIIGASGAISGVLGAYLLLYPTARVTILVWIIIFIRTFKVSAALILIGWFLIQLFSSLIAQADESGGVAFNAHIGGFLAGMILVGFFRNRDFVLHNPVTAIIDAVRR